MQPYGSAFVSGEGVRLVLSRAGVGSRTLAASLDLALQATALFLLILLDLRIRIEGYDLALAAGAEDPAGQAPSGRAPGPSDAGGRPADPGGSWW